MKLPALLIIIDLYKETCTAPGQGRPPPPCNLATAAVATPTSQGH